jgi:hypothetical protein
VRRYIPQARGGRSEVGDGKNNGGASLNVACAAAVVLQAYALWAGFPEVFARNTVRPCCLLKNHGFLLSLPHFLWLRPRFQAPRIGEKFAGSVKDFELPLHPSSKPSDS